VLRIINGVQSFSFGSIEKIKSMSKSKKSLKADPKNKLSQKEFGQLFFWHFLNGRKIKKLPFFLNHDNEYCRQ
jgi:hypothetical protein